MWSHTLLNEGFGPLFCLFVCLFVCLLWRACLNIAYIKHGGLAIYNQRVFCWCVLKVFLVPSLEKCGADMVVLDLSHHALHYPYDTCKKISSNTWNILLALCTDTVACSGNIKQPNFSPLSQRCSVIVHAHMARRTLQNRHLTSPVYDQTCVSCSCQAFDALMKPVTGRVGGDPPKVSLVMSSVPASRACVLEHIYTYHNAIHAHVCWIFTTKWQNHELHVVCEQKRSNTQLVAVPLHKLTNELLDPL